MENSENNDIVNYCKKKKSMGIIVRNQIIKEQLAHGQMDMSVG